MFTKRVLLQVLLTDLVPGEHAVGGKFAADVTPVDFTMLLHLFWAAAIGLGEEQMIC